MPCGHWLGLPPDLPHMIVRQLQEPFLPWHERQAGLRPVKKSRNGAMLDESPASGRPAQYARWSRGDGRRRGLEAFAGPVVSLRTAGRANDHLYFGGSVT